MPLLDYARLYKYRFRDSNPKLRVAVWRQLAIFIAGRAGNPETILDPAAGNMEFLLQVPGREKWGVDMQQPPAAALQGTGIKFVHSDIFNANLPAGHFDMAFVSNFLEHLPSPERIADLLRVLHDALKPGGRLVIMGPNFRYCAKDYFDCADHRIALTDVSIAELLYCTHFELESSHARFLPFSFRGALPASALLARVYLRMPWAWRFFGRQFLVTARKPGG